ncbi:hypothetical protein D3C72_869700 [compost metagenome]
MEIEGHLRIGQLFVRGEAKLSEQAVQTLAVRIPHKRLRQGVADVLPIVDLLCRWTAEVKIMLLEPEIQT